MSESDASLEQPPSNVNFYGFVDVKKNISFLDCLHWLLFNIDIKSNFRHNFCRQISTFTELKIARARNSHWAKQPFETTWSNDVMRMVRFHGNGRDTKRRTQFIITIAIEKKWTCICFAAADTRGRSCRLWLLLIGNYVRITRKFICCCRKGSSRIQITQTIICFEPQSTHFIIQITQQYFSKIKTTKNSSLFETWFGRWVVKELNLIPSVFV